jgi:ATP-binding cassette, subfamily B, bacterial
MDNAAFTRATRFLNYSPVAKWLALLCGIASAALYVGLLLVLFFFADLLVERHDSPSVWVDVIWGEEFSFSLEELFLLALAIALARLVLLFLSDYLAARATIAAITRLRRAIYQQTYRLGTLAFRALGPTEAVSVSTRHLEAVHSGLYAWLTVVFREPVKFGLLLVFAVLVNFWLALAFLLFALLVWVVGGQIAAYFRRRGRAAENQAADQLALIQESLMLMRLVKVYLMEHFNQTRFEDQLARYADAQLERYRGEAIYRPVFAFLGLLAGLVLLTLGGLVILNGHLDLARAIVMVTALVSLYWPMAAWLENRRLMRRSRDSAKVLFDFLDRTGSVGQGAEAALLPPLSKKLEYDNVTFREPGSDRLLLRGISLSVQAGQRIALVGPEDLEKLALIYLLPRFLDPTSGEIRIDRKNLRWVTLDSLRTQIAIVLQHNLVFNDTVANNIGCGDKAYSLAKIIEAAKVAHAHQFIQTLPKGYETVIGEMGYPLKSGEMFRIALARAILREPAIVVIEEPSLPMDEDTKAVVDDTFARFLPGRTVIFLAHRLSTIRNCDSVYLIYQGKVEGSGDHRELLASNDLYRHLQYLEFTEFASLNTGMQPIQADHDL